MSKIVQKFHKVLVSEDTSMDDILDAFAMIERGDVQIKSFYKFNQDYVAYSPAVWALIYDKQDLVTLILKKYGTKSFSVRDNKGLYPVDYLLSKDLDSNSEKIAAKLCHIATDMCGYKFIEYVQTVCRDNEDVEHECDSIQCCHYLECVKVRYHFVSDKDEFTKELVAVVPCSISINADE